MFIFVLGNTKGTSIFADKLAENKNNIVFSTAKCKHANFIDISPINANEIKDFILANEISLLIIADENLFNTDYNSLLCDTECLCFYPEYEGLKLVNNLYSAMKFAYKNKLNPPKFSSFDKYQAFLDYIQTAKLPIIISPENLTNNEAPFIAETKDKAKKYAEKLYLTGSKRIIIQDYISGFKYTKYFLLNNYTKIDFLETVSYFDEAATNNLNYLQKKAKEKIQNEIIPNLIEGLIEDGIEYTGILGVSFIIDKNNNPYFYGFSGFLNEPDLNIMLNTVEDDLSEIFKKTITEENPENKIKTNSKLVMSIDKNNHIITASANTMSNVLKILDFEGADQKLINEAIANWKK